MAKEEEIPDWVGAQEFYMKYEPKEILGRYVLTSHIMSTTYHSIFYLH